MARIETLEDHPTRCALAPESPKLGHEIRVLLLGRRRYKYRLLFRIVGQKVEILRVWHSSRDSITQADL